MCMLQQISPWKNEKKTFDAALFCFSDGRYSSLPVITMSVAAESISELLKAGVKSTGKEE